jgi:hypothetical protein
MEARTMKHRTQRRAVIGSALAAAIALGSAGSALAAEVQGPSSSQDPYVVREIPGVVTKSILTTGDSVNTKPDSVTPYRMVGIPDGLGAYDNGDGTFTVLMNHELGATAGVTRAHGRPGAFVSKWTIDKDTLQVLRGEDLVKSVNTWDTTRSSYVSGTTTFGRLCSADLAAPSAFFNAGTGKGYAHRLFLDGEEVGNEGRAFAHVVEGPDAGVSWELPRLGKFSWENAVANPATGDRTVVVGLDDSTPGQVYVYAGDKQASGTAVDQAGLGNGSLYGITVSDLASESGATQLGEGAQYTFGAVSLGNVENTTGAQLQTDSVTAGVFNFNRPEDGAWDPNNANDFYFVTTGAIDQISRLWRLRFVDASQPQLGGTLEVLVEGPAANDANSAGPKMMDNMTVDSNGRVIIQEDTGNNPYLAGIFQYDIASGDYQRVARHDANRFQPGGGAFITQDEESSGVIPVFGILGNGWYLADVQSHLVVGGELVEGGQLFAFHVPVGKPIK